MSSAKVSEPNCHQEPGIFTPVVNRKRCEGKADCVVMCPVDVFELGILPEAERATLGSLGKIKGFFHGWKQAYAVNAEACQACGLCVRACPEKAITLERRQP